MEGKALFLLIMSSRGSRFLVKGRNSLAHSRMTLFSHGIYIIKYKPCGLFDLLYVYSL